MTQPKPQLDAGKPQGRSRTTNGAQLLPGIDGRSPIARRFRDIRMTTIISDAGVAHSALQAAIGADGGVALEAYGAGLTSDQPIAKLVEHKETTAKAAGAAKDALPGVRDALANARAVLAKAENAKFDAVILYLKARADFEAPPASASPAVQSFHRYRARTIHGRRDGAEAG
jgi:hypothetical protein